MASAATAILALGFLLPVHPARSEPPNSCTRILGAIEWNRGELFPDWLALGRRDRNAAGTEAAVAASYCASAPCSPNDVFYWFEHDMVFREPNGLRRLHYGLADLTISLRMQRSRWLGDGRFLVIQQAYEQLERVDGDDGMTLGAFSDGRVLEQTVVVDLAAHVILLEADRRARVTADEATITIDGVSTTTTEVARCVGEPAPIVAPGWRRDVGLGLDVPAPRALSGSDRARVQTLITVGRKATVDRRYVDAAAAFDAALALDPGAMRALSGRGYARLLAKDYERASDDLEQALVLSERLPAGERGPFRAAVYFNVGLVAEAVGDAPAACGYYLSAYELVPSAAVRAKLEAPGGRCPAF